DSLKVRFGPRHLGVNMRHTLLSVVLSLSFASAAACTDSNSSPSTSSGTAGSTNGAGGQITSGAAGSGNATTGSGGHGGCSGSTGGTAGTVDSFDASRPEVSVGSDANGSGDAAARPLKPSAGCGKTNPPMGNRTIMTGGRSGTFIVHLPTGYNATKPMPLG